jgi:DNA-binding protein HU-beta
MRWLILMVYCSSIKVTTLSNLGKEDLIEYLTTSKKKSEEPAYESVAEAKRAIENTIEAIKATVQKKDAEGLTIVGLGGFKRVKRAARKGVNPATGESIKIKASKTLTFKISKPFKDSLK